MPVNMSMTRTAQCLHCSRVAVNGEELAGLAGFAWPEESQEGRDEASLLLGRGPADDEPEGPRLTGSPTGTMKGRSMSHLSLLPPLASEVSSGTRSLSGKDSPIFRVPRFFRFSGILEVVS